MGVWGGMGRNCGEAYCIEQLQFGHWWIFLLYVGVWFGGERGRIYLIKWFIWMNMFFQLFDLIKYMK
jgi:hypothetical protein